MNLTEQIVIHKKYGIGKITKIVDNHIYIKFQDHNELKTFIYPSCFKNGFLKLKNENIIIQQQPQKLKRNQTAPSVAIFYEKYKKALQEEISYLRKNGGKKQKLSEGKLIEFKKGKYIYSFESDIELSYPEGTPIIIWHRQVTSQGTIAACEDYTVIIETEAKLGRDIPSIDISPEPWRLLNALIERIENINDHPSYIVKSLVCDGKNVIRFIATTVSKAVIDPTIYESDFNIVIFDEASMAYIPQIVFSASLAIKHFVCMGVFRAHF